MLHDHKISEHIADVWFYVGGEWQKLFILHMLLEHGCYLLQMFNTTDRHNPQMEII